VEKHWLAEKLGKNLRTLEHAGGRDAMKTGLSILKSSANVASWRPFGPKTQKLGCNLDLSSKKYWKRTKNFDLPEHIFFFLIFDLPYLQPKILL